MKEGNVMMPIVLRDPGVGRTLVEYYMETRKGVKIRIKKPRSLGRTARNSIAASPIPLVYTRGAEEDNPLPPRNYTLTVYLTAAVQGHPSGTIDGVRAYTATSNRITISRYDYRDMPNCPVIANLVTPNMRQSGTDGVECPEVGLKGRNHLKIKIIGCHAEI
jgi:hypothetical protein